MDKNIEIVYNEGIIALVILKSEITRIKRELSDLQDKYNTLEKVNVELITKIKQFKIKK
jgi:hypothetical protein